MIVRATLLALALALPACKSAGGVPATARTTVLSFPDLDCADCGEDMAKLLVQSEGVHKTAFDKRKVELTVVADPGVDVLALAKAKKPKDEEWTLVAGAGRGAYKPWTPTPKGADVVQVAVEGKDVPDLAPHLVSGKVTVIDFSAIWCDPCRELDEHVMKLVGNRSDVAYRKLDIGDWDTPLAKRYLAGIKELPYVLVFDGSGKQVDAIAGLHLDRFDAAIARAAGKPAP